MADTGRLYACALKSAFNKEIHWDSDAIKVALFNSSYTPDQNADQYYDALSNEVANGGGYATGGAALAGCSLSIAALVVKLTSTDLTTAWGPGANISDAKYAVIYDSTPASNKPLIAYVTFAAARTVVDGTLTITWDATNGLAKVTLS
jgi:hypothetical protein